MLLCFTDDMANIKSAIKRVQVAERNRQRNLAYKSNIRKAIKQFFSAAEAYEKQQGSREDVQTALSQAFSILDKAVNRNVIHRNTGARRKARLAKRLQTITHPPETTESSAA